MDFFADKQWITIYKDDFLQKLNLLEENLEFNTINDIEYSFVVTLSSAFLVLRQYLVYDENIHYKKSDILKLAYSNGIVQNKQDWNEAIHLSKKIGRAVRSKDENAPVIKNMLKIFKNLRETLDPITGN